MQETNLYIKFNFSCMLKINNHTFNNYITSIILFESYVYWTVHHCDI